MQKAEKVFDALAAILGLVLIAGVLLNFGNAILRYGFGRSIVWAEEILIFGLILIVMAGLVVITARSENLSIDILIQVLPKRLGRVLAIASGLTACAVFAYLAWNSLAVVQLMHRIGQTSVAARIPIWIPHSFLFGSFALAAVAGLYRSVIDMRLLVSGAASDDVPSGISTQQGDAR